MSQSQGRTSPLSSNHGISPKMTVCVSASGDPPSFFRPRPPALRSFRLRPPSRADEGGTTTRGNPVESSQVISPTGLRSKHLRHVCQSGAPQYSSRDGGVAWGVGEHAFRSEKCSAPETSFAWCEFARYRVQHFRGGGGDVSAPCSFRGPAARPKAPPP